MAKDSFYFSHDYNTRSNDKIKNLLRKHGMLGYGIYWAIVEDLYNNANALRYDYEGIAYDYRVSCEVVKSILNDFLLFDINGDILSCEGVEERLQERNNKSESARLSAQKRWGKNANALPPQSESNAIKERKGKERKENIEANASTESESFSLFKKWLSDNAKSVLKMKEPFTEPQFLSIREEYKLNDIMEVLLAMHNYKDLHKNLSANLTFRNWAKRRNIQSPTQTVPSSAKKVTI